MEPDRKMASASAVLRVYWAHMVRYPWWCALAIVCTVGMQAAELAGPWYLRRFFNIIATRTPEEAIVNQLLITVAILGVIWVAQLVATRTQYRALMYVNVGVMKDLFGTAFEYLIGHSYTFFISRFAGSLTHRVSKFARAYETLTDSIIMEFFPTTLFIIGAVAILFSRNHTLGIALATWSLVFIGFQIYVSKLRQPSRVAVAAADTKVTASLADAISNHVTITLFSGGTSERSRFSIVIGKWAEALTHVWTVDHRIWAGIGALQITLQVGLLYGATIFWSRGLLTIGDFVLIQSYILITFTRLTSINRTLRRFYDALADAQEFVAILEEPHSVQDVPDAPALAVAHGAVDFKDVSFYFNEQQQILTHLNLAIKPGEKVALVGPSGAGKSTITKLLLRFYDVKGGSIEIDGQNIAQVTQDSLREAIAFVPQEPILFHRTLTENIRYGKRDATDEEVIEAAKKAHCHEFIQHLKYQYDTYVGERGVKLSGGERQRVAIARAILKDAPILILDEATSSLDSESESLIQDSLKVLMQGKTVLVIAHRLSTIMNMDRIVVIEGGDIVADGTHQELLAQDGLYAKLWSIQAGGFLRDDDEGSE